MASLEGKNILVVDDDPDLRRLVAKYLHNEGALVTEADNTSSGMLLFVTINPDLVLLDLNFPDGNGFEFLKERKNSHSTIPTIVLSGQNDKNSVISAASLGACDYLVKPFRATHLLQKIRKALKVPAFGTLKFTKEKRPKAQLHFEANVEKITEVGLFLNSPVKLGPNCAITIQSEVLKELGAESFPTISSNHPPSLSAAGRFSIEILFAGLRGEYLKNFHLFREKNL